MSLFKKKNYKTIRTNKKFDANSIKGKLLKVAHQTLGSGDLSQAVRLPDDSELEDWLAVHVIDFFNGVNMLWSIVVEDCDCETMSAGKRYIYAWRDGIKIKKPIQCPAKEYVGYLLDWVDSKTKNPELFPEDPNVPFPKNFKQEVSNIFRRYFRVYAHIYFHHLETIKEMNAMAHLNTTFKHFYWFVSEFKLCSNKDMEPLQPLIDQLIPTSN